MGEQLETIEAEKSFNWRALILWPFIIVVLYVLSAGPVVLMLEKGIISGSNRWIPTFYAPLDEAYHSKLFHKPFGIYLHLWAPDRFDENGDK